VMLLNWIVVLRFYHIASTISSPWYDSIWGYSLGMSILSLKKKIIDLFRDIEK
jgi:F420-0:gamma-glutamyl ligase-like protein